MLKHVLQSDKGATCVKTAQDTYLTWLVFQNRSEEMITSAIGFKYDVKTHPLTKHVWQCLSSPQQSLLSQPSQQGESSKISLPQRHPSQHTPLKHDIQKSNLHRPLSQMTLGVMTPSRPSSEAAAGHGIGLESYGSTPRSSKPYKMTDFQSLKSVANSPVSKATGALKGIGRDSPNPSSVRSSHVHSPFGRPLHHNNKFNDSPKKSSQDRARKLEEANARMRERALASKQEQDANLLHTTPKHSGLAVQVSYVMLIDLCAADSRSAVSGAASGPKTYGD